MLSVRRQMSPAHKYYAQHLVLQRAPFDPPQGEIDKMHKHSQQIQLWVLQHQNNLNNLW